MDRVNSNIPEVFTIAYRDIPGTIYVETRFITLAAAKRKKYEKLFYLINKNGQLELTQSEDQFIAIKNFKNTSKSATVTASLQSIPATPVVPQPTTVKQSQIPAAISTLTSLRSVRPISISKLGDSILKTNTMPNLNSLPRVKAIPIINPAQMPIVNSALNTTTSCETTATICSKFNDNMQQTEISYFNMTSVGIQCQLAEENEDLEMNWPLSLQDQLSDNMGNDNIEITKENILKFVQENSTEYKNSYRECLICGEVCKSKKYFYMHMAIHQGPKVMCSKCGLFYENEELLRKHSCFKANLVNKIYLMCPHYRCGVTAISKLELYDHLNEHDNYRPYKCTGCRKAFFTRQEFLRHTLIRAKCFTQLKRKRYCIYNLENQRDRLCRVRVFTLQLFKRRTVLVTKFLSRRATKYRLCKICLRSYGSKNIFKSHRIKCGAIFLKRLIRKRYGIKPYNK